MKAKWPDFDLWRGFVGLEIVLSINMHPEGSFFELSHCQISCIDIEFLIT